VYREPIAESDLVLETPQVELAGWRDWRLLDEKPASHQLGFGIARSGKRQKSLTRPHSMRECPPTGDAAE
jgi:hypothetical protein